MMRVITTPAVLPPAALAELKQWLAISTTADDGPLSELLQVALEVCADFTGLMPLSCMCEEMLPPCPPAQGGLHSMSEYNLHSGNALFSAAAQPGWQRLETRPVLSFAGIDRVNIDGSRTSLDAGDYAVRIEADGSGEVQLMNPAHPSRYAVQFAAGLASSWMLLPDPLRHGIIRLAAHQHRTRENPGAGPLPPASVSALWLPWRQRRLT